MQIKKAGAVAVGALATVAAMGAPAAAAVTQAQGVSVDRAQAMRAVGAQFFGTARNGWDAPWDQEQQSLLAAATGSAANVAAWQNCGGVGGWGVIALGLPINSAATVMEDCRNGNIKLAQDTDPAIISLLNDTAISVASWQNCGGTIGGGLAAVGLALQSPTTVLGGCNNANVDIS